MVVREETGRSRRRAHGSSAPAFFLEALKSFSSSWPTMVAGESLKIVSLLLDQEGGGVVEC
jgi:hypothetical protein